MLSLSEFYSQRGGPALASSSSLQPDTPSEQESASSSSSTPLSSSSSSSNTSPEESRRQRHVHFATISERPSVVGLRSHPRASVDEAAKNSKSKTMFTDKALVAHNSVSASSEEEFESEDGEFEFINRKVKGKSREYNEKEKEKSLADAQRIISRLQKERQIQKGEGEETTNLKISIAVLENQLTYAKSEKEAVEKSLGILIEFMARIHFSTPPEHYKCKRDSIQTQTEFSGDWLDREIELLRKENRSLRTKNRELDDWLRYGKRPENGWDFGDPSVTEDKDNENEVLTPTPTVLAGTWGPTEPSIPISTSISNPEHADVGLNSLEDLLGNEDDAAPSPSTADVTSSSSSSSSSFSKGEGQEQEETRTLEEQANSHQAALRNLNSASKPSVLKVGFVISGSFRGSEYDADKLNQPMIYPKGPRRMQDYDRFGAEFAATQEPDVKLGVFNDWQERDSALNEHARLSNSRLRSGREQTFPEFFRHGIVYTPSENAKGYLRTVHIGNLPNGIHLRDVLARVRGGDVLSAILLDTRRLTGGMSARVVFKTQEAAESYTLFTAENPVVFDTNEEGEMVAEIALVSTPTFPVPANKQHHLASTRCLQIPLFPSHMSIIHLERTLGGANAMTDVSPLRKEALLELWLDESHALHLVFSSIENAGWAWDVISLQRLSVKCENDPCSGDVKELLDPLPARPPMLPRNGQPRVNTDLGEKNRDNGNDDVIQQRKCLAALSNQKVDIPSFGGEGIKGRSWADEVEEEEGGAESKKTAQAQHIEDISSNLNTAPRSPALVSHNSTNRSNIPATYLNDSSTDTLIPQECISGTNYEISSALSLLSAFTSTLPTTSSSEPFRKPGLHDLNIQATDHHRQFSRAGQDYRGGLAASRYAPVGYQRSPLSRFESGVDFGGVSEHAKAVGETETTETGESYTSSRAELPHLSSPASYTQGQNKESSSKNLDLLASCQDDRYNLQTSQASLPDLIAPDYDSSSSSSSSSTSSEEHKVVQISPLLPERGVLNSSPLSIQGAEKEKDISKISECDINKTPGTTTEVAHLKYEPQNQDTLANAQTVFRNDGNVSSEDGVASTPTPPFTADQAGQAAMAWYGYGYGKAPRNESKNAAEKGKEKKAEAKHTAVPVIINSEEIDLDLDLE